MTMTKFDKCFSAIIIGFIISVTLLLLFGYVSLAFIKNYFTFFMIAGICTSIIINVLFLNKIIPVFYNNSYLAMIIYLLYMTGFFGFFMGVPVFNIVPGIFAGFYIGRKSRINNLNYDTYKKSLSKTNVFTSIVLCVFMIFSSIIALTDKYTGSNIKGMLHLKFEINYSAIVLIIIIGGFSLLLLQYFLSIISGNIAYNKKICATTDSNQ